MNKASKVFSTRSSGFVCLLFGRGQGQAGVMDVTERVFAQKALIGCYP